MSHDELNEEKINKMLTARDNALIAAFARTYSEDRDGLLQQTLSRIKEMDKKFDIYVLQDTAWKTNKVEPIILWFGDYNTGKRFVLSILKGIGWTAGAIIAIGGAASVIWFAVKYIIQSALNK